jgi:hypothetical protein
VAGEPVSVRAAGTVERALKWARRKPTQAAACALSLAVVVLLAFGATVAALWWRAERAKGVAEKATEGERKARVEVEAARERLRETLDFSVYGRTIQAAHQEWRDNNVPGSLALLEGTRPDLRGWEWKYVHRLCHGELRELKGHTKRVYSVSWSPDGSRIATASEDQTARVWDARTGAELEAASR